MSQFYSYCHRLHEIEYFHSTKKLFLIFEFIDFDLRKALEKVSVQNQNLMIKVILNFHLSNLVSRAYTNFSKGLIIVIQNE